MVSPPPPPPAAHDSRPGAEEATVAPHAVRRQHNQIGGLVAGMLAVLVAAGLVAYFITPKPSAVLDPPATASGGQALAESPGAGLPELAAGRPAPGFDLQNLRGGTPVSLQAFAGHPVVLNFFASWCASCRAELGAFAEVSGSPHGQVEFVGVDTADPNPSTALDMLNGAGDSYPVGIDRSGSEAGAKYLVQALPVTVFIGASGTILGQVFGTQTAASLQPWLQRLQASSAGSPP